MGWCGVNGLRNLARDPALEETYQTGSFFVVETWIHRLFWTSPEANYLIGEKPLVWCLISCPSIRKKEWTWSLNPSWVILAQNFWSFFDMCHHFVFLILSFFSFSAAYVCFLLMTLQNSLCHVLLTPECHIYVLKDSALTCWQSWNR